MALLVRNAARRSQLSGSKLPSFRLVPLYMRRIAVSIVAWFLAVLILIEGVFLAEKFTAILRSAIDKHARLTDVLLELLCTAPEILNLAIPIAIMFGVYRVTLRCREDREFLVIAGTGNGFRQLLWLVVGVALSAQVVSIVVSGAIEPLARFAGRAILFNAEYRALRGGISPGQLYNFPGHMVFAGARTDSASKRWLFIHEKRSGATDRVITADRAVLEGPNISGTLALQLGEFSSYEFANSRWDANIDQFIVRPTVGLSTLEFCLHCGSQPAAKPLLTLQASNYAQEMALSEILPFKPRGRPAASGDAADGGAGAEEWTLFELLGLTTRPAAAGADEITALGQRASRSLLCLLAPLIALVALAHTTRATQALAFPAACVALMCIDLGGTVLSKSLAPAGPGLLLAVLLACTLALIALLVRAILTSQQSLVKPGLARA